jgi:predicted phage terminase large subunit-like protein
MEPKDLEPTFMQFWSDCMRHKIKPQKAAIEKKSTGTFLLSVLQKLQGMSIIEIERTRESGSKTARFLEIQPYIASKQISLPSYGRHSQKCIEHMRKITANDTHRHDDRADTCYDAIKLGLIDKSIYFESSHTVKASNVVAQLADHFNTIKDARSKRWQM